MIGFDQFSGMASNAADQYGLDRAVFFGLIETESAWNPQADAPTSSAYGFTQLLSGTAKDLGVDLYDPQQNLMGGAKYLSQQVSKFGDIRTALAAYHDGPGAVGKYGGFEYADKVLSKAQKYAGLDTKSLANGASNLVKQGLDLALKGNPITAPFAIGADLLGINPLGGDSCGIICQLKKWIKETGIFQRIALAILAFIVLFAAFYLMKDNMIDKVVSKVKG